MSTYLFVSGGGPGDLPVVRVAFVGGEGVPGEDDVGLELADEPHELTAQDVEGRLFYELSVRVAQERHAGQAQDTGGALHLAGAGGGQRLGAPPQGGPAVVAGGAE